MSNLILLINNNYEPLNFITEKRALKLLFKDKVDVLSNWNNFINFSGGKFKIPSVLKLKKYIKKYNHNPMYSKYTLLIRDKNMCQYCGKTVSGRNVTLDHVIPISRGGKSNYTNVVVSCFKCNNNKGNKTPEEANMTLLKKPEKPNFTFLDYFESKLNGCWHEDWKDYLY